VPRVDLAADDRESFGWDDCGLESADELGRRLRREEAHLVALRILRNLPERIPLHDLRKLRMRARDDSDVEPEGFLDQLLAFSCRRVGLCAAREHDVAALELRPHVVEALTGQKLAQVGHGDPVARSKVDAAEQDDLASQR
jgi:hypothetical protein